VDEILVIVRGDVHVAVFVVSAEIPVFGVGRMNIVKGNARGFQLERVEFFCKSGHWLVLYQKNSQTFDFPKISFIILTAL